MSQIDILMKQINMIKESTINKIFAYIIEQFDKMEMKSENNFIALSEDVINVIKQEPVIEEKLIDKFAEKRLSFTVVGGKGIYIRNHRIAVIADGKMYSLSKEIGIEEINRKFSCKLKPLAIKLKGELLEQVKLARDKFGCANVCDEFRRNHYNLHITSTNDFIVSKFGVVVAESL